MATSKVRSNLIRQWLVLVAIMVLAVVFAMVGYRAWEGYTSTKELDGENANNHSCVKLMKAFPLFKDKFNSWNGNKFKAEAQSVAYSLAPGMTDMFMESDTTTVMKGNCVIPDISMPSYNMRIETRSTMGGDETLCIGESEDGKVNVVLPYMHDKVSGCGLVFNKYDAKGMEKVLLDLHYLSDEQNEKLKDKAKARVNPLQNTVNAYNTLNNTLTSQSAQYRGLANNAQRRVEQTQSDYNAATAATSRLTSENADLKARFTSTW